MPTLFESISIQYMRLSILVHRLCVQIFVVFLSNVVKLQLFDPNNPDDIADKILTILNKEEENIKLVRASR